MRSVFLVLSALVVAEGVVVTCPGTAESDDCNCQQTENGVICPAGYYCPQYNAEVIAANMGAIIAENCTIRSDGELQCPCTPGFYCPANTLSPSYCCESYFCQTPASIEICSAGDFCKVGNVAGIPCGSERDCPEGSSHSGNAGMIITAVVIFLILFLIFSVKYFVEAKVREAQRGVLSREKELSEGGVRRMTVDGTDPRKTLSIGHDADIEENPTMSGAKSSSIKAAPETYRISFEGVGLVLKSGVKIMHNVTGEFLPMRTCAIMGPSGAGKVMKRRTTDVCLLVGQSNRVL